MEEFPNTKANVARLAKEVNQLGLPGYVGVAQLARRWDDNGILYSTVPYVVVRCDTLTAGQKDSLRLVIAAHNPSPDKEFTLTEQLTPLVQPLVNQIETLLNARNPAMPMTVDEKRALQRRTLHLVSRGQIPA